MNDEKFFIVKFLQGKGLTAGEISEEIKLPRSTCALWLGRAAPPSQQPKRRPSPKQLKGKAHRRACLRLLLAEKVVAVGVRHTPKRREKRERASLRYPFRTACALVRGLWLRYKVKSSRATVRRDLKELGLQCYRRRRQPRLEETQKKNRVVFCKFVLSRGPTLLIAFSDEKYFDSNDNGGVFFWAANAAEVPGREYEQGAKKILVWGVVGVGFRHLVVLERGTLTQATYRERLLLPSLAALRRASKLGLVFQQDNAPAHRGADQYLRRRGVKCLPTAWPACSPDLSPIETVWSWLAASVAARGPWGEEQLAAFVREEWDKLPQARIDAVCTSFAGRCTACIAAKGGVIKPPRTKKGKKK